MLSALGHLAAEARESQRQSVDDNMNRHLMAAHALHGLSEHENPFVRRASLGGGLSIGQAKKRPKIDIILQDQPTDFRIPSYTTRERIVGHAAITSGADLAFDHLHITLQGTSRTWVEKIATTAPTNPRTRAFHTFLRLLQPIEESEMPEQHILRAGRTYVIPFEFVVPERLLPQTCSHPRENSHVEEEHLKLPPSLGDAMVSGDGKSLLGDHAPEMTTITYSLRCIITKSPTSGTSRRPAILADEQQKLRIIPAVDELPPLAISDEPGEDYVVHRIKKIKKGILMGKTKIGSLDVQAKQPAAMRLPTVRQAAEPEKAEPVMTMVNVRLRFDPCKSGIKPPKLQNMWSRLKIATFFATVPQKSLPSKSAAFSADINKGLMVETLPLSALNLGGVQWNKRTTERRDSGFGTGARRESADNSSPDESPFATPVRSPTPSPAATSAVENDQEHIYYVAEVTVPVELPYQKHAFVPTFHSCLVSRIYALDLSLSCTTGTGNSTNAHLKIPIQICSTASKNSVPLEGMIPEGGFIGARSEHRDMFAPNMARPDHDDDEAPPDFDDLSIHEDGAAAAAALGEPVVDSDGEITFGRPAWTAAGNMRANDPAHLAAALDQRHLEDINSVTPGARSPTSRTPVARSPLTSSPDQAFRRPSLPTMQSESTWSPSPRQAGLTNDQILNTEDYENAENQGAGSPEMQFGSFRFEPQPFARPGDGVNRGQASNGEWRRASEALPPGYASVAAGTMLMGSGGLIRALS